MNLSFPFDNPLKRVTISFFSGEENGFYFLLCRFLYRRLYKSGKGIDPTDNPNSRTDMRAPPSSYVAIRLSAVYL
jgi:hypothetical protein